MARGHSTELQTAIIAFVDAGRSMREAARHFDVSPSSVVKLIKKKNAEPETYEPRRVDTATNREVGDDREVSARELADLLGVDPRSITNYASRGQVIRSGRNRYALKESVRGYCEHLREMAAGRGGDANQSLATERARLAREQADHAAMKNAELRRELLPAGEVEREWSDILRTVRSRLLACTSRIRSRLPHLTPHDGQTIDIELRDALSELADDQNNSRDGTSHVEASIAAEAFRLDGESKRDQAT